MDLHLGGGLAWYDEQKRTNFNLKLDAPIRLEALFMHLGIPSAEVAIVSINGKLIDQECCIVQDSDSLKLFPSMGGG